jgi:hypothetical protein
MFWPHWPSSCALVIYTKYNNITHDDDKKDVAGTCTIEYVLNVLAQLIVADLC